MLLIQVQNVASGVIMHEFKPFLIRLFIKAVNSIYPNLLSIIIHSLLPSKFYGYSYYSIFA